jgi:Zn-dependent protease
MFPVLDNPGQHTRGQVRFRIFGTPVTIQPWFWFGTLIMGASRDAAGVLIWLAVVLVSILLHEFGHVAAFKIFGVRSSVLLYGFGGLAIPEGEIRGTLARVTVPAAGPIAGFLLAGLVLLSVSSAGGIIVFPFTAWLPHAPNRYWNVAINDLLWVNVIWGFVNLLPIYPLDGGQLARALFDKHDPVRGKRRSLILSATVATICAVLAFAILQSMYMVAFFGVLAAMSFQSLDSYRAMFKPSGYRR